MACRIRGGPAVLHQSRRASAGPFSSSEKRAMKFCPQWGARLTAKIMAQYERRLCSRACGFVFWNNPIPVGAGLVKLNNHFILARNSKWPSGYFSLISGFQEAGEAPASAIARETQEELGLHAEHTRFIGHYVFPHRNQLIMAFIVYASGDPSLNEEIAELKVLTPDQLAAFVFGPLQLGSLVVRDLMTAVTSGSHDVHGIRSSNAE